MNSIATLSIAAGLLACYPLAAQQPAPEVVSPDKGTIDVTGKFVPMRPADAPPSDEDPAAGETKLRDSLRVEPDGPDRFRIGEITFDRARREIIIPAEVNMDRGVVEYALVAESGKVHEALLTTKANPREIHLACLLLGLPVEDRQAAADAGVDVKIHVTWDTNGPAPLHELANLVATADHPEEADQAKPLPSGPWRYVSSQMTQDGFSAALEGSVIALIHDPAALVVNPRESAAKDDHHVANPQLIPAKGSPVRIILTLPPSPPKR